MTETDLPNSGTWAAAPRSATGPLRLLRKVLLNQHILSLAGQAMLSALSFGALICLGHWGGIAEIGAFAVGTSVVALALAPAAHIPARR